MKTFPSTPRSAQAGSALMLTLILTTVALVILAGAMDWSANSARMTYRYDQYGRAVVAAEGDTEKVIAQIQSDFVNGGLATVNANLSSYSQLTPTAARPNSPMTNVRSCHDRCYSDVSAITNAPQAHRICCRSVPLVVGVWVRAGRGGRRRFGWR